jgi:(1->4)-alpha-D-glucan 1-alpha-D-glucosylmutase
MMHIPTASYRLQLNKSFGFADVEEVLTYLAALGISDIYTSPIFKARKGSLHGYDIVDFNQISPECGGLDNLYRLSAALGRHGLSWLQDIVPNHMAFDSENHMLMDILEQGENSPYFGFFDIEWNHAYENMRGRVLAPFLGRFYAEALEDGEIQLEYTDGNLGIRYYDIFFPLRIESYAQVLSSGLDILEKRLAADRSDFTKFLGELEFLKTLAAPRESRDDQIKHGKKMLWSLYSENSVIRGYINETIAMYNGAKGAPENFDALDRLISEQLFRLSYWKVASEEINYRRFFTINDLISLRTERRSVFDHIHGLVFRLINEGVFQGLRVDHVDGLYDPHEYLNRLRAAAGDLYIAVEKILDAGEQLPQSWPVQGTTGYDFMNFVNRLFCRKDSEAVMSAIYYTFTSRRDPYEQLLYDTRRLIIDRYLAGNIDNLAQFIKKTSVKDRYGRDITLYGLRNALVEVMTAFPVYRTYISESAYAESDRAYIQAAIQKAKSKNPGLLHELGFIEKFLLLQYHEKLPEEDRREWLRFAMQFQQFTGPLMAKSLEDTTLYIYNRFISLNEVGGNPRLFSITSDEFHAFMEKRIQSFPHSMNATATHDTKRGEDVRARINVLSELPQEWRAALKLWSRLNRTKKKKINGMYVPDKNDEYFLYQTLIGTYPFPGGESGFTNRIRDYLVKAVREAKVHTAWLQPDSAYEEACSAFVENILRPGDANRFLGEFMLFQKKIAHYGIFNSLSQTLLKITSPGVPDFYQGSELWDLSLVDPDNRRPVDFKKRQEFLRDIMDREQQDILGLIAELLTAREDGRIKLFLIYRALKARRDALDVVQQGTYIPLMVTGTFSRCIIAFARTLANRWLVTVAPRCYTALIQPGEYPFGEKVWQDTRIVLPENAPGTWRDALSNRIISGALELPAGTVFSCFPVALLVPAEDA